VILAHIHEEIFMRKRFNTPFNRGNKRVTDKWNTSFNVVSDEVDELDLSLGSNDHDKDDDDDGLGVAEPGGAVNRLKRSQMLRTAAKSKLKTLRKPRAPRRRVTATKARSVKIIRAAPTMGPKNAPEPTDRAVRRLWRCKTIDEVKAEHALWAEMTKAKCLKAIERRKLPDEMRSKICAILDGTATDRALLTTNKVLALAFESSCRAIWAATKDDHDMEFALVTFIPGDGGTSLNAPVMHTVRSDDPFLKVLRSMSKDFIGAREWAMFNSHGHPDGGRHLQGHEHALLWGHGVVAKAQEVAQRRLKDFAPNITGAPQINVRRVQGDEVNIARMCAYLFKSPHKAMNWKPPHDGKPGHMNQSEKGDRMIRYLRMAQIRSLMSIEDVMFAGGQGVDIRSDIIKLVRQTCHADVPVPNRVLHPDELGRFWADVNQALKRPYWRLPVVARQH